jgi:hypothetical protein
MLIANAEMDGSAVAQLLAAPRQHFLKQWFGLVELVLLEGAQPGFIVLKGLRGAWVVRYR